MTIDSLSPHEIIHNSCLYNNYHSYSGEEEDTGECD